MLLHQELTQLRERLNVYVIIGSSKSQDDMDGVIVAVPKRYRCLKSNETHRGSFHTAVFGSGMRQSEVGHNNKVGAILLK